MRYLTNFSVCLSLLGPPMLCTGCRAPAAMDAGFLEHPEVLHQDAHSPFDAVWYDTSFDPDEFDSIVVAPVDTTHLLKMAWWSQVSIASESGSASPEKEAVVLAGYFREQVSGELKSNQHKPKLSESPKGRTLSLELAIVEVVPTKVWLNSLGYALVGALDHGSIAMEGRFRDLSNGKVVARWKDREYGRSSIVNVSDLTWYGHAKDTIQYWSGIMQKMSQTSPDTTLEGRTTVTLLPW